MKQVEGFVAAGGEELVLSGINLGRWGRDFAPFPDGSPTNLAALVRYIFEHTELPRLRLSSIEPMDWDADLIGLMAEFGGTRLAGTRICRCSPDRTPCCAACIGAIGRGTTRRRLSALFRAAGSGADAGRGRDGGLSRRDGRRV